MGWPLRSVSRPRRRWRWALLAVVLFAAATLSQPATAQDSKAVSGLELSSTTSGELVVAWEAPDSEPDDYRVMWVESTGSWPSWSSADGNAYPDTSPYTITGLDPGVSYKVKVRARYGGEAAGPWSDKAELEVADDGGQTPPAVEQNPKAISGLVLSSTTPGELVVSWDAPTSEPDDYRVMWAESTGSWPSWSSADGNAYPTAGPYTITGLEAGVSYKVKVRARYSGQSAGPWSDKLDQEVASSQGSEDDQDSEDDRADDELGIRFIGTEKDPGTEADNDLRFDFGTDTNNPVDDYPADSTTTGTIAVNGSASGVLEVEGDRDWFAVQLTAGRRYQFSIVGTPQIQERIKGIYDSSSQLVMGESDGQIPLVRWVGWRMHYTPPSAGTYYVSAGTHYDLRADTYTLWVTDVTDDYGVTASTAGTVSVGGSAYGTVETSLDRDWFSVSLQANRVYVIDLERTANSGVHTLHPLNPKLWGIRNSAGDLLANTANDDDTYRNTLDSRVVFKPASAGTYYIEAGAKIRHSGNYKLSVTDGTLDASGSMAQMATPVRVGSDNAVQGRISTRGERNWYSADFEAGNTYHVVIEQGTLRNRELFGVHYPSDHPDDDLKNTLIPGSALDRAPTMNRSAYVIATVAGTYRFAVGNRGSETGTYTVKVTRYGDDYPDDRDTPGQLVVDGAAIGGFGDYTRDKDRFAVDLEAGTSYRFIVDDWLDSDDTGSTVRASYMQFYAPNGTHAAYYRRISGLLQLSDWSAQISVGCVRITPPESGTYYVAVDTNTRGAHDSDNTDYSYTIKAVTGGSCR